VRFYEVDASMLYVLLEFGVTPDGSPWAVWKAFMGPHGTGPVPLHVLNRYELCKVSVANVR
jgi:hypothetical protein